MGRRCDQLDTDGGQETGRGRGRRRGHSLGPGHPVQDTGVHQDGSQGGEERHLGPQPKPDNETLLMTSLSSVSVHLVRFRPPGHRVMIGGDGTNVGTPGHMETVASHRASDCLVTSIHWSRDGLGLRSGQGL